MLKVCGLNSISAYPGPFTFTTTGENIGSIAQKNGLASKTMETTHRDVNLTIIPNPVTGVNTIVSYRLIDEGKVSIRVVDLHGHSLETIDLGYMNPGDHMYHLNQMSRLANGYYIVVLEQNNYVIARKQFIIGRH